jgi:hypothetical protein
MDPITVILGALTAVSGVIGDQVIKDGYASLKALIARKFGASSPRLEGRIEDFVEESDTDAKAATKVLAEKALQAAGADKDPEVVAQAYELLKQAEAAKPPPPGASLVGKIEAAGGIVTVVGRDNYGGINIGSLPKPQS